MPIRAEPHVAAPARSAQRARLGTAAGMLALGVLITTWASRVPLIKQRLELSTSTFSLVLATAPVGAVMAMQLVPRLIRVSSGRVVSRAAVIVAGLSLVAMGLADTVWLLAVGLFVYGLSSAALDVCLNLQGVAVERRLGRPILAGLHGIYSIGTVIGALLGAALAAARIAPALHFALVGGVVVLAVQVGAGELSGAEADQLERPSAGPPARRRLGRSDVVLGLLGAAAFACFLVEGAVDNWAGIYLHQTLGTTLAVAPLGSAAFAAGMTVSRVGADRLIGRWGRLTTMTRCATLAALGGGLCVAVPLPALTIGGFGLLGLGAGPLFPISVSLASAAGARPLTTSLAWVTTFGYTGFVVGPPLIGLTASVTGLRIALAIIVALELGVLALTRLLPRAPTRTPLR